MKNEFILKQNAFVERGEKNKINEIIFQEKYVRHNQHLK